MGLVLPYDVVGDVAEKMLKKSVMVCCKGLPRYLSGGPVGVLVGSQRQSYA